MFENRFTAVWNGEETWNILKLDNKRSVSDLVQANVVYKYHTGQTGKLKPQSWTDKLKKLTPPAPADPVISATMEQNFVEWRFEFSFPNFFISAPGAWIGVNIDVVMDADGGWSWNENDWNLEFDLAKWASDVVSEGAVLNVDTVTGRLIARFLGKALSSQTMKLVFTVTTNIQLETLVQLAATLGAVTLSFWSQELTLQRLRLGPSSSVRPSDESG